MPTNEKIGLINFCSRLYGILLKFIDVFFINQTPPLYDIMQHQVWPNCKISENEGERFQ